MKFIRSNENLFIVSSLKCEQMFGFFFVHVLLFQYAFGRYSCRWAHKTNFYLNLRYIRFVFRLFMRWRYTISQHHLLDRNNENALFILVSYLSSINTVLLFTFKTYYY